MKSITHRSTTSLIATIVAAFLFVAVVIFMIVSRVSAVGAVPTGDGRLVTIHDKGTESVILTEAATIGDALKEAGIVLDDKDSVEPQASEKLVASE